MNISLQTTEEYTHKLYPRVIKQEMLSTQAHEGKENIENGIINKPPVNSESKEQEQKEQEQVENIHNPTKTDSSSLNPILKLYQNNSESLNKLAMSGSYVGIALHGLAAAAPFLNFIPKPVKELTDKLATFYSRYLSGVPMMIFSMPQFIAKDTIKALAQISAAVSFPFIKTVENMPVGSSLFCGIKTAIEAIEEYKGPKVNRKSDSLLHQIEEFTSNYGRMWKDSLSKLLSKEGSLEEKFRNFCNITFLPGYSVAQGLGMLFCKERISDKTSSKLIDGIARGTRTERGILGVFTDIFLLGSKIAAARTVGITFAGSSLLSLTTPWVDKIFNKHPKETQEKILNILGQTCKALDELGNVLWSKIPKEPNINNSNLAAVS
ncbi:MAG: hypothetical protein KGO93_05625 [Cyanobacteria bacterium REEB446]|nr:hypothetical protein [Cyanobacteria bacterium REEB446]